MGKGRATLHPLDMGPTSGARAHSCSPTFGTKTHPYSPTLGAVGRQRRPQQDSSTESSPEAVSSDDDVSAPAASGRKDMRMLIEGFTCPECDAELTILTGRQCSFCGGDENPFYCITCSQDGCRKPFCMDHETCWDHHLPRSIKTSRLHKRIDPLPQLFVDVVTHSAGDHHKQKQMHQRDEQARWFNIRRGPFQGRPDLFIYDRFVQLCDPTTSGNTDTKRHYPSFVSFVGDTSVGKSTLVRAMLLMGIANPTRYMGPSDDLDPYDERALKNLVAAMDDRTTDGPVTRSEIFDHQKYPTTCGVHLYRDEGISMGQTLDKYPILFADCEGFNAGEAMTNAERLETDEPSPRGRGGIADPRSRASSRRRDLAQRLPVTASCYNSRGKDGIDLFYARFLYAVSDVIVFVTKDDTKIQTELTRVLEWASAAVHKSVNHPSRKTLVIVRNMANFHDPAFYDAERLRDLYLSGHPKLWEDSAVLRDFVRDYNSKPDRPFVYRITTNERLYKALFNGVVCCCIPNKKSTKGRPQELFGQYRRLRDTIEASVREGLTLRAESVMQYNVPALAHILNRAFGHFTASEEPFDFYLAARRDNPNPQSMTEHVANFLRHAFEGGGGGGGGVPEKEKAAAVDVMVRDVVSVALLTYTYREFSEGLGARPEEIFERELDKICGRAVELYTAQHETCAFGFDDGQACASRPARLHTAGHKAAAANGKGHQFEPGPFVHRRPWRSADRREWIADVRRRFVEGYEAVFIHKSNNGSEETAGALTPTTPEERLTLRRERGHGAYKSAWKAIKSNKTCLACLQAVPDHVLTCGHSYCARCVQELGAASAAAECAWTMRCRLCWEAKGQNLHVVQLRPRCAGVRILALDGGGVRGIVELAVLDALRAAVGLDGLPPKDLFDLVVGTSTGGIVALAVAMSAESGADSIPRMMDFFGDVSRRTFAGSASAPRRLATYALMALRLADSVFGADGLRRALQEHFRPADTALFAPAMHTGVMSSGTRVAVTSAKDLGQTACLITSYNHPSSGPSSASPANALLVEREEDADKDMKIWEAALATSAAPFYLPPFTKPETGTQYVDGAVYANCPAQVAYAEMERLWPEPGAAVLDTLVSLGTGLQQRARKPSSTSSSSSTTAHMPGPSSSSSPPKKKRMAGGGFFVSLRAMFQRQLDSKGAWASFRDAGCPAAARCRLWRLDPPLLLGGPDGGAEYVEMYDHGKIDAMRASVAAWAAPGGGGHGSVRAVADSLVANLFFFEPDGDRPSRAPGGGGGGGLLADPSLDTLRGSVRCRLGHGTPELQRLLGGLVEGFAFTLLRPSTGDVLAEVARVPAALWERVVPLAARARGREARAGEMLVAERVSGGDGAGETTVLKFRLPCTLAVRKGSGALLVLAVKLVRCEHMVPISGFPCPMGDLARRAKMKWLQ